MKPASTRALGSTREKEKASQAANLEGLQDRNRAQTKYPTQVPDTSSGTCDPDARSSPLSKRRKPSGKFTGRRRAAKVLRDVQRLAGWRRDNGVVIEGREKRQFAWVMAKLLVGLSPSYEERTRLGRLRDDDHRHGLDFLTLTRAMNDAGLDPLSEAETMTVIHEVQDWHDAHPDCPISGKAIGRALRLRAVERLEAKCWNILAVDETKKQREERRKERNRICTRERMRARREEKRMIRLAKAEKRRAFCEHQGISERTLNRWIADDDPRVLNLFDSDISLYAGQTISGHGLGNQTQGRVFEPESSVPDEAAALACLRHKEATGGRSSSSSGVLSSAAGQFSIKDREPSRNFWPHVPFRKLITARNAAGYRLRKERQALRQRHG